MQIKEITYFRRDGLDKKPAGIFYAKADMYNEIYVNENSFVRSPLTESFLHEDVRDIQGNYEKYQGGMITFSTDVNDYLENIDTGTIKKFLMKLYYSTMNHIFRERMLTNMIREWQKALGPKGEKFFGGFTIGKGFKGRWVNPKSKKVFDERSFTIELGGLPSELLLLFATQLCQKFKQDSVLVKDFNTDRIFYVDANDIPGSTPDEKIVNASKSLERVEKLNSAITRDHE